MSIVNSTSLTPSTRKRTRDETDGEEIERTPFTIRDPLDPFAATRSFTPLRLVARAQLPLASLDTAQSASRLFSAHIQTLESSHDHGGDATILLAQDQKERRVYAIERVKSRTYALCRLGTWVTEADLQDRPELLPRLDEPQAKRQVMQPTEKGQPWWARAAVNMPPDGMNRNLCKSTVPKLSMAPMVNAPEGIPQRGDATETRPKGCEVFDDEKLQEDVSLPEAPFNPQDVLQELAKQYMEALYASRTSLAYFTKGPLSRARAAFVTNSKPEDLIEFLRDSILTSAVMDKKFRAGISGLVRDLPVQSTDRPEKPAKKRKKKWKAKRDKIGFFAGEDEYVEGWWRTGDELVSGPSSVETVDAASRRRMPRVRNRETLLQVILALEVLALEASIPPKVDESRKDESQMQENKDDSPPAPEAKKSKPKKKQDLAALLETLIDKLCIWHSLEANSPVKRKDDDRNGALEEPSDELKSFCIEVVTPFYTSRIPQNTTIVNKKLGGPCAPTPVKRQPTATRKPGEPATRQAPERKPRKPLTRVSTDTLNRSKKHPPSLQRSVTDSEMQPSVKREASEVPLDSIPVARPQHSARRTSQQQATTTRNRPSLMSQISFSKREVDLSAMSQASEAKMRKKAEVDEKLREAISTLRKPNRLMAVKEIADSADETFAKATAKGRQNHAQRLKAAQSVHVTATPKHVRTVKATPHGRAESANDKYHKRSSGSTYVPSSSTRLPVQRDEMAGKALAVPQTGHRPRHGAANVEETPSRGFAKFMPPGLARQPGTLDSPAGRRSTPAALQGTPSKAVRSLSLPTVNGSAEINATPVRVSIQPLVSASLNATDRYRQRRDDEAGKPKSIYDTLGWNDEYEEMS